MISNCHKNIMGTASFDGKFSSMVRETLPAEDVQLLRQWIKSTGGIEVGNSIVKTDNTGALAL